MSKKKDRNRNQEGMVYSTTDQNSGSGLFNGLKKLQFGDEGEVTEDLVESNVIDSVDVKGRLLYLSLDRKRRAGKQVTLIEGMQDAEESKRYAVKLKQLCGAGGSFEEDCVIIQGDHREKVMIFLIKEGFKVKKKGG